MRALGGIFEHSPWVAEAVAGQRPFATLAALHAAMKREVQALSDDKKLALLRVHPDLAGKAAQAGEMTGDSKSEQGSAGLDRLSAKEFDRFQALNAAYHRKFDFPFILCVRRHSRKSIFRQFERRLENDRASECRAALDEIFRITALRLDQHVSAPDKLNVHGFMDVHVIDSERGVPAEGLSVSLHQLNDDNEQTLITTVIGPRGLNETPLVQDAPIPMGDYELRFAAGAYFARHDGETPAFLHTVPVRFAVGDAEGRYHIPVRISRFAYTVHRGN